MSQDQPDSEVDGSEDGSLAQFESDVQSSRSGSTTPRARSIATESRERLDPPPSQDEAGEGSYLDLNQVVPKQTQKRVARGKGAKMTAVTAQALQAALKEASPEALAYVCRELDCHPGENDKEKLIVSLMDWRILQRHQGLDWAPINSHEVLQRLHDCLRQLVRPSWVVRPQLDVGLPSARKVKAAHWKRMYEVFLPLTLLSLWQPGSPTSMQSPASMSGPLQTAMHLSCACLSMIADVSTEEQRDKFSSLFAQHLDGLERDCPGISTPNHHVSFHIRDFMSLLGPVRNWWCFPFERLVSRMQRTGNNHRAGYEKTLLSTFYERAFFRQTLLRINIPYVQDFRRTMDRLFHFDDKDDEGEGEDDDDDDKNQDDDSDVGDPAEVELDDSGEIITFQSPASPLRFDLSQRLRSVPLLPRGDGRNTDAGTIPAAGVRIGGKTYSAVRERHSY
ncbi:hypothetical protein K525DRAFT_275532, partial [Schizophyllum commune Loenen D]